MSNQQRLVLALANRLTRGVHYLWNTKLHQMVTDEFIMLKKHADYPQLMSIDFLGLKNSLLYPFQLLLTIYDNLKSQSQFYDFLKKLIFNVNFVEQFLENDSRK